MAGKVTKKPAAKPPAMTAGAKAGMLAMAKLMNSKVIATGSSKNNPSKGK